MYLILWVLTKKKKNQCWVEGGKEREGSGEKKPRKRQPSEAVKNVNHISSDAVFYSHMHYGLPLMHNHSLKEAVGGNLTFNW